MGPVGECRALCFRTLDELTMDPPGNLGSAPSEWWVVVQFLIHMEKRTASFQRNLGRPESMSIA